MFFPIKSITRFLISATIFYCSTVIISSDVYGNEEEMKAIQQRALEIIPMLDDAPNYGSRTKERAFWDERASSKKGLQVIKSAEELVKKEPPVITEELYKEFYSNGNRHNYEKRYHELRNRFKTFALAEILEQKGRFVSPLEDALTQFCALPSWVYPAHDKDAEVYDGKADYSDLGSTAAAGNIAVIINLIGDKLSPELVAKLTAEIERRVLTPYEKDIAERHSPRMWWIRGTSNWNAVCTAGTIGAALNIVDSKERRAFFIAAAEYFSEKYFMRAFTDEGYSTEGLGYWNYGFGHYEYLAALVRIATKKQVDFFRFPKIHGILDCPPQQEIDKGNFVAFADCNLNAHPYASYVGYLSRLKGYGYTEYEQRGLGENFETGELFGWTSIGYDTEITFPSTKIESTPYSLPLHSDFPSAGVTICRPSPDATGRYFAVAFKGGNNDELHNHNDIGSYSLILGSNDSKTPQKDVFVCQDPGSETYTKRTFSSHRYEGELLNSYGHPVPKICGSLQVSGKEAKGVVLEKNFSDELDVVDFDMTSAYKVDILDSVRRRFEYKRAHNSEVGYFEVRDTVNFKDGQKGEWETALITFEKNIEVESTDAGVKVNLGNVVVSASSFDRDGNALALIVDRDIVGEDDPNALSKPTRLAFRIDGATSGGTIALRYEVE